ncbi:MAG: adenylyl-sulfate kinase [Spirochaetales bacterium]|nr:adenylyl-sulfate kinase [Spirochaetales bacterium]
MEQMNIVFTGHVDHGKSTVIGRLLADTGSLPMGKLEQVRKNCLSNSRPFEYAFLIDALKDEQAQGITIDSARVFFNTGKRNYIIIDAPGHIEFLKNMVTGASRAEAAFLVIDAKEGVRENSRRHGFLLSMLGIKQMIVLVNKMDLVGWNEAVYRRIVGEYSDFLKSIELEPSGFIPISAAKGANIIENYSEISWYRGMTVLEGLDSFRKEESLENLPLRIPVQDVYKFTGDGDDRRIVAGTIESGTIEASQKLVFYPSGKRSRINTIEAFNGGVPERLSAGQAAGFTLEEQIYIRRGELATAEGQPEPFVSSRIRVALFWLGRSPMVKDRSYLFKLGTGRINVRLEEIIRLIDASTLDSEVASEVKRHEVAECVLKLEKAAAFDIVEDNPSTSRFVIVDDYEISGGGIIKESLDDSHEATREHVWERNFNWARSEISIERRAEKYNQRPALIVVTGSKDSGKKAIARGLENLLFEDGHIVNFVGIGSILYGIASEFKKEQDRFGLRPARMIGEISHLMLSAGLILILTAIDLTQEDLEELQTVVGSGNVEIVQIGPANTDIQWNMQLEGENPETAAMKIKSYLLEKGYLFKPW